MAAKSMMAPLILLCVIALGAGFPSEDIRVSKEAPENVKFPKVYKGIGVKGDAGAEDTVKYEFKYDVNDYSGNEQSRSEKRDDYGTKGQYTVLLPDGKKQVVKYIVDDYRGYRADVTYEETQAYPSITPKYPSPNPTPALTLIDYNQGSPFKPQAYDPEDYNPVENETSSYDSLAYKVPDYIPPAYTKPVPK